MKLSTRTRYGLRILLQIALDSEKGPSVRGRDIAEKQEISEAYLEQIMIPLKSHGMVKTVRGCKGGYALCRPPEKITVLDMIRIFEGNVDLVRCCDENGHKCSKKECCVASGVWEHLTDVLAKEADKIKLSDLVEKTKTGNNFTYVI